MAQINVPNPTRQHQAHLLERVSLGLRLSKELFFVVSHPSFTNQAIAVSILSLTEKNPQRIVSVTSLLGN